MWSGNNDADEDRNRPRHENSPRARLDRRDDEGWRAQGGDRERAPEQPTDASWTRRQGLYGSNEYGGWLGGQFRQGSSPSEEGQGARARVQGHAGKGPKGWQRSDERIRDEVCEALARHPGIDATDIEVQVSGGEVTLAGGVNDRPNKRLAEDIADAVFGVQEVQNQLRVKRERDEGMEGSSGNHRRI